MNFAGLPPEMAARLSSLSQQDTLQIPPPVFLDMEADFDAWDLEEKWLRVRFPVRQRYQNPLGHMQGGMISAAVDNTIGPLSFLVAPPNVTKSLTLTYLRPVTSRITEIVVTARLEEASESELTFSAEVRRGEDTLLAAAEAHHVILRRW